MELADRILLFISGFGVGLVLTFVISMMALDRFKDWVRRQITSSAPREWVACASCGGRTLMPCPNGGEPHHPGCTGHCRFCNPSWNSGPLYRSPTMEDYDDPR
jgi:hypothetical protein